MQPISIEGKPFQSIAMVDKIVDYLEKVASSLKPAEKDNKYVIFAVRDLVWMSLSIISSISRNLHWRYNAYTAASMTRLLMECVTELKYVMSHRKKAKAFWQSQQKIKNALQDINEAEKWNQFSSGILSKYGQLSDSTTARVKSMLGVDDLGRYNLFCFYSHPNIAGYSWVAYDQSQPGIIINFAAETYFKMIDELIRAISSVESQQINLSKSILDVQHAYIQYLSECESGK